jgi:tetraacyldisaccharide 4'-kinase
MNDLIDFAALQTSSRRDAERYAAAQPFPHIVIETFLTRASLANAIAEFPSPEAIQEWRRADAVDANGRIAQARKLGYSQERHFGPTLRREPSILCLTAHKIGRRFTLRSALMSRRIERIWYEGAAVPFWLGALVPVYKVLRALPLAPYHYGWRKPARLPVPVIVVGNLTAGGSGKTPLVIALVEALRVRGFKPGVVSRGYGGTQRTPLLLDDVPLPAHVGDEPCLIRKRTGAPVAVGRDRARAAALLLERGVNVVIADDGLQNPSLARDLELCVIDGRRRFGNGRLLPAGPLREPVSRLDRIAFRVCNGGAVQAGEIPMRLEGAMAVSLAGAGGARSLDAFAGQRVHGVAAIGNPERFFDSLRVHGIDVVPHAFADHHAFAPSDLVFGDDAPVLMTEKDAIKCVRFASADVWCVPVRAELPEVFFDAIAAALEGGT